MTIYHRHHILPKHAGGTDDPSNIIIITVEEHAETHRKLYEKNGRWQDLCAYKVLSHEINQEEAVRLAKSEAGRMGGKASKRSKDTYKNQQSAFKKQGSCFYCNRSMDIGNLAKYHGNNCKLKFICSEG